MWLVRSVRYRKHYLIGALVASGLVGAVYFFTADRIYEASSQLLVQQMSPVVASGPIGQVGNHQGMLPTYEKLFASAVVLNGAISRIVEMPTDLQCDLKNYPREDWVRVLREQLTVRSFRSTHIIEIRYRSQRADAAEAVVGAIVDACLEFMDEYHRNVASEVVAILHKERKEVEQQLVTRDRQLLNAKRSLGDLGMRDASNSLHPLVQRVVQINDSLIEAQQKRIRLQATYDAVQLAMREGRDLRQYVTAVEPVVGREVMLAALGLNQHDVDAVAELDQQLVADRTKLANIRVHYGDRHPKVQDLLKSIRDTQNYLENYQQSVADRAERTQAEQLQSFLLGMVKQEVDQASAHESQLKIEYVEARDSAVQTHGQIEELAIAEREVERLRSLHHTLQDRIASIDINQNQADVRVEVVSDPKGRQTPVSPRLVNVFVVSLLGGTLIGIGLVYVIDALDDHVRSPDELKDQLGLPILAMIRSLPSTLATTGVNALHVATTPDSVESEAFRTLRTTIAFAGDDLKCVAVSSSEPGDGKTTVVANLGATFAQANLTTLMIDADLRKPGMTRLFELRGQEGLSDLLRSDVDVRDRAASLICKTSCECLHVLPSGSRPLDPTGLLASNQFGELLAWAEARYDQILIDCPPTLVASDAAIAGRIAGGLMLVVQPAKNHRRSVFRCVEETRSVGVDVVGLIVNRLTADEGRSYYGDSYGYGYGDNEGDHEPAADSSSSFSVPATPSQQIRRAA